MESLEKTYERIQKYANTTDKGLYDLSYKEIKAISECSPNVCELICTAFNFGFEKGCRKTKKAIS